MTTTNSYIIDDAGKLDSFAIETETYVEEK